MILTLIPIEGKSKSYKHSLSVSLFTEQPSYVRTNRELPNRQKTYIIHKQMTDF